MSGTCHRAGWVLVGLLMAVAAPARGAAAAPSVLIVSPRHTILQLGFDMVQLRGVTLLTYRQSRAQDRFVVYVWDVGGQRWAPVGVSPAEMRPVFRSARSVFVMSVGEEIPRTILTTVAWSGPVQLFTSFDLAEIVNGLNEVYRFSPREWQWLAARYKLQIEDRNYERRRYGRFGPPAGRRIPADGVEAGVTEELPPLEIGVRPTIQIPERWPDPGVVPRPVPAAVAEPQLQSPVPAEAHPAGPTLEEKGVRVAPSEPGTGPTLEDKGIVSPTRTPPAAVAVEEKGVRVVPLDDEPGRGYGLVPVPDEEPEYK